MKDKLIDADKNNHQKRRNIEIFKKNYFYYG